MHTAHRCKYIYCLNRIEQRFDEWMNDLFPQHHPFQPIGKSDRNSFLSQNTMAQLIFLCNIAVFIFAQRFFCTTQRIARFSEMWTPMMNSMFLKAICITIVLKGVHWQQPTTVIIMTGSSCAMNLLPTGPVACSFQSTIDAAR